MKLEVITEGLRALLVSNNYKQCTIIVYEREWEKIKSFLIREYGDTEFDMDRGLHYLEKQYAFISDCNNNKLTQQRVQLLRIIHMLEDYALHKVITRRYYASKNVVKLNNYFESIYNNYFKYLDLSNLAKETKNHYLKLSKIFMDYLNQKNIISVDKINIEICNDYLKTLSGYSFKTVEQQVCGLKYFIKYLVSSQIISDDCTNKIHMPNISKNAKNPSAWSTDELKAMINKIDRNNPIGKRDYAMILLACVLGLRIGDIKRLTFNNINWEEKKISIIQHKTHKPLVQPLPDVVGWAIIDYIKNGRPSYYETNIIFIKHMPPFNPLSDNDRMYTIIIKYMRKAGIDRRGRKHSGFHSLRHSAASMLLEMETPLPVITNILGHSDPDITSVYMKTDLQKLAECVLPIDGFENE